MGEPFVVWVLVISDLALAAALGWTTRAAATGRLRVNALAGIRTSATMASQPGWVAAHTAAWPMVAAVAASSLVGAVGAVIALLMDHLVAAVVIGVVPVGIVLVATIPIVRIANRAARAAKPG
ncbi:MAG: SdpI family protein [Phycicoccus sp.]|nr:SdpI family protein [Phycicoccus sp.]